MRLNDVNGIDPNYKEIVVFFNARPDAVTFSDTTLTGDYVLHSVQQNSADEVVKSASYSNKTFNVPSRTTAVFVIAKETAPEATAEPTTAPATETNSSSLTITGIIAALLAITGLGIYLRRRQKA